MNLDCAPSGSVDVSDLINCKPRFIHWDVVGACNLRCLHCRATSEGNINELSTDEGLALIDQIAEFEPDWMSFDGGEPLLQTDIYHLIEHAAIRRGLFTYLLSNGVLITPDVAARLKTAGLGSVQISIDGLEETHDRIRGRGTYRKSMAGIANLQEVGLRASMRCTLNGYNIRDAVGLLQVAIDMDVAAFGIRRVIPCGNSMKQLPNFDLDKREYYDTMRRCMELGKGRIDVHVGMDPVIIPTTHLKDDIVAEYGDLNVVAGCGAGITLMHIGSDGEVYGCGVLPISGGNVRTRPLREIWADGAIFKTLRDRDQLGGACVSCQFKYVCGGCRASALGYTGDFLAQDPFCLLPGNVDRPVADVVKDPATYAKA